MPKIFNAIILSCLVVGTSVGAANAAGNSSGSGAAQVTKGKAASTVGLTFNSPFDVFQIHTTAPGSSFLTVGVLDCCIAGDKWKQRTFCLQNNQVIDVRGLGRGTTSGAFTGTSTVFRGGAQEIDCITEVRYGQGVSVFPAGMTVGFTAAGAIVPSPVVSTTLVPLPSE